MNYAFIIVGYPEIIIDKNLIKEDNENANWDYAVISINKLSISNDIKLLFLNASFIEIFGDEKFIPEEEGSCYGMSFFAVNSVNILMDLYQENTITVEINKDIEPNIQVETEIIDGYVSGNLNVKGKLIFNVDDVSIYKQI